MGKRLTTDHIALKAVMIIPNLLLQKLNKGPNKTFGPQSVCFCCFFMFPNFLQAAVEPM